MARLTKMEQLIQKKEKMLQDAHKIIEKCDWKKIIKDVANSYIKDEHMGVTQVTDEVKLFDGVCLLISVQGEDHDD